MRVNGTKKESSREAIVQISTKRAQLTDVNLSFSDDDVPNSFIKPDGQQYVTEQTVGLVFTDSLYDFLNFKLRENKKVTEIKKRIALGFVKNSPAYVKQQFTYLPFNEFFNNFLDGVYDEHLSVDIANASRESYNNLFISIHSFSNFTLRFKDAAGNLILQTAPVNGYALEKGHAFSIDLPLDDTTTTVKEGYSTTEAISCFYYNTYYQKEYPIDLGLKSFEYAIARENWLVREIKIEDKHNEDFNPEFR